MDFLSFASPNYLEANGEPHSLAELMQHNCLTGTLDYWRFKEKDHERMVQVSGNLRANSGPALVDAALKHIGIVQLPDYYVLPYIKTGALVHVLPAYQPPCEGIWAVYNQSRHLSSKIKLLSDFLAERLKHTSDKFPKSEFNSLI